MGGSSAQSRGCPTNRTGSLSCLGRGEGERKKLKKEKGELFLDAVGGVLGMRSSGTRQEQRLQNIPAIKIPLTRPGLQSSLCWSISVRTEVTAGGFLGADAVRKAKQHAGKVPTPPLPNQHPGWKGRMQDCQLSPVPGCQGNRLPCPEQAPAGSTQLIAGMHGHPLTALSNAGDHASPNDGECQQTTSRRTSTGTRAPTSRYPRQIPSSPPAVSKANFRFL